MKKIYFIDKGPHQFIQRMMRLLFEKDKSRLEAGPIRLYFSICLFQITAYEYMSMTTNINPHKNRSNLKNGKNFCCP